METLAFVLDKWLIMSCLIFSTMILRLSFFIRLPTPLSNLILNFNPCSQLPNICALIIIIIDIQRASDTVHIIYSKAIGAHNKLDRRTLSRGNI